MAAGPAVAVALVACSTASPGAGPSDGGGGSIDARATADARGPADAARPDAFAAADAAPPDATLGPYRHTIAIDGVNDFGPGDGLATTTPSYAAYLTWDDQNLYLGYDAADVASGDATKWLMVYVDRAPGQPGGSATGETYNSQTPRFPDGFLPDDYYRWQASGGVEDIKTFDGNGWSTSSESTTAAVSGTYLEVALPLSRFGAASHLSLTAFWLDEEALAEWSYGGLYGDSFTDGYHADLLVGRYVDVDLTSTAAPAELAHRRP